MRLGGETQGREQGSWGPVPDRPSRTMPTPVCSVTGAPRPSWGVEKDRAWRSQHAFGAGKSGQGPHTACQSTQQPRVGLIGADEAGLTVSRPCGTSPAVPCDTEGLPAAVAGSALCEPLSQCLLRALLQASCRRDQYSAGRAGLQRCKTPAACVIIDEALCP